MRDNTGRIMGVVVCFIVLEAVLLLSACVDNDSKKQTLKIAGSTTAQPIVSKAAEEYMKKDREVFISVQGGGSGTGIRMVSEGSIDIAMSSREIKQSEYERYPDLRPYTIAADGIVVVVHPSNPINGLAREQVKEIFSGEITNFKEIGGPDREIVVVIRESGSGTRATFEELVMDGEEPTKNALQKPSNGAVKATVTGNPNAIGYIGLGYVDNTAKALKIDGVTPSTDTVKDGSYPVSRRLYVITKGEATGLSKDFIDFILSDEGQRIVEDEGFVSIV